MVAIILQGDLDSLARLPAGIVFDSLWTYHEDRTQDLRFYLAENNTSSVYSVNEVTGEIRVLDAVQLNYWSKAA